MANNKKFNFKFKTRVEKKDIESIITEYLILQEKNLFPVCATDDLSDRQIYSRQARKFIKYIYSQ